MAKPIEELLQSRTGLIAGAIVIVVAIFIYASFYTIGPGHRGVLLKWGAVVPGSIAPGAHFKLPVAESVVTLDVRVQKYHAREAAASKDLQDVSTEVAVNFHLVPGKVGMLYKNVGNIQALEQKVLTPSASNAVKAVVARYNAEELVQNRDSIKQGIANEIISALKPYSVKVDAVNITNFKFSGDYAAAIEQKQVAQQKALQSNYELQKAKIDAQQQIVKAEAHAKATLVAAHAEAKALELKRKAVTPELIMLNAVNKWDGKMPATLVTNGKMLPVFDTSRRSGK
ncbi:MAG TPA: prohibitin family protein [Gammaproteobacteria bacterium]|nr:prohibitin family protein [Gammaproteobacteria bacterium]